MQSNQVNVRLLARTTVILLFILSIANHTSAVAAENAGDVQQADESSSVRLAEINDTAALALAEEGSAQAQYELGLLFEYGRGVKQNDQKALYWYEKSASQHYTDAMYRLAILHDNGWGAKQDKKKALDLYKAAAEKGHAFAQHDLAIMYFKGMDAPKSLLQAYKWLKIAVSTGNPLMQKHLNRVAKEMSFDEIETASYLANDWISRNGQ